jgi:mannosyltransferase OCH1-like enzyme
MIPKKVHLAWKSKELLADSNLLVENGVKKIVDLNTDWEVTISDDQEIIRYLKHYLSSDDWRLLENTSMVDKCDLWRLFKIYHEGGLYIDIDRFYNVPMKQILMSNTQWLLPTNGDYDFSHDIMCSAPLNPVFLDTINLYLDRRRQGCVSTYFLGAQTYMHVITTHLVGRIFDTNPGIAIFDELRDVIVKTNFITTYREQLPSDTVVYHGTLTKNMLEQMKKELYLKYKVKHWDQLD